MTIHQVSWIEEIEERERERGKKKWTIQLLSGMYSHHDPTCLKWKIHLEVKTLISHWLNELN